MNKASEKNATKHAVKPDDESQKPDDLNSSASTIVKPEDKPDSSQLPSPSDVIKEADKC